MGYMGFGMRKEVYTRKPKRPFKHIKKFIGVSHYNAPKEEVNTEFDFYTYHKPAYKRWWFITSYLLVLGYLGYWSYHEFIHKPLTRTEAIEAFEDGGILDYFTANKASFDSLYLFAHGRDQTLTQIGISRTWGVALTINSRSDEGNFTSNYHEPGTQDIIRYWVQDGSLMHQTLNSEPRSAKSWVLEINIDNIDDLDQSFIEHLQTNRNELDLFLRTTFKKRWNVEFYSNGTIWHFRHLDEDYVFYLANEKGQFPISNTSEKSALMPGVYWSEW